jgi:hypothetical protein
VTEENEQNQPPHIHLAELHELKEQLLAERDRIDKTLRLIAAYEHHWPEIFQRDSRMVPHKKAACLITGKRADRALGPMREFLVWYEEKYPRPLLKKSFPWSQVSYGPTLLEQFDARKEWREDGIPFWKQEYLEYRRQLKSKSSKQSPKKS